MTGDGNDRGWVGMTGGGNDGKGGNDRGGVGMTGRRWE